MTSDALRRDQAATGRITITRRSAEDVGYREVYVSVDEERIAILHYGESVSREVPVGRYQVRAHNTLVRRAHDVTLEPGDHVHFTAVNRPGWGMVALLAVIGVGPIGLTFRQDQEPPASGA